MECGTKTTEGGKRRQLPIKGGGEGGNRSTARSDARSPPDCVGHWRSSVLSSYPMNWSSVLQKRNRPRIQLGAVTNADR